MRYRALRFVGRRLREWARGSRLAERRAADGSWRYPCLAGSTTTTGAQHEADQPAQHSVPIPTRMRRMVRLTAPWGPSVLGLEGPRASRFFRATPRGGSTKGRLGS